MFGFGKKKTQKAAPQTSNSNGYEPPRLNFTAIAQQAAKGTITQENWNELDAMSEHTFDMLSEMDQMVVSRICEMVENNELRIR